MNPMSNIESLNRLNERELELGIAGTKTSWHHQYRDSAWIFVGGLPYDLTEGDIICAFSQYGELVNINLIRDKSTGKSKGYCFICYEDQRSTVLTVDNMNGIKLLGRTIRVDHVSEYKVPKEHENDSEAVKKLRTEGVAPKVDNGESFRRPTTEDGDESDNVEDVYRKSKKKDKKHKREKHRNESDEEVHKKSRKKERKDREDSDEEVRKSRKKHKKDKDERYRDRR